MDKAERLALVVKAQVAVIRAEQARERHAPLERRANSLFAAAETLKRRYGEDMNPADHADEFKTLVADHDGASIPLKDVLRMLAEMSQVRAERALAVGEAFQELSEAMGEGTSALEWVGCSEEELERAVQAALDA